MVPLSPGASIKGLYVVPPSTRSAQGSPVLGDMEASNGCIRANAEVTTGVVGAPAGPYGPINEGMVIQAPHGTSGSVKRGEHGIRSRRQGKDVRIARRCDIGPHIVVGIHFDGRRGQRKELDGADLSGQNVLPALIRQRVGAAARIGRQLL
jgi:hypothetical protein